MRNVVGEEEKKKVRGGEGGGKDRKIYPGGETGRNKQAGTGEGREGGGDGRGQQERVQDKGVGVGRRQRRGVGNKGRERGPIWSILALGVSHCGSIREGESKKRNRGLGGRGGSQTIFYSITA